MNILRDDHIPANSGWGAEMTQGQVLRFTAMTIIDFVCLNKANPRERFDQARTKTLQFDNLDIGRGHPIQQIRHPDDDHPRGPSRRDRPPRPAIRHLQRTALRRRRRGRQDEPVPSRRRHPGARPWLLGESPKCPGQTLRGQARDIPSPLNLFQHVEIDARTGEIKHSAIRPAQPIQVDLRAEIDLIVAQRLPRLGRAQIWPGDRCDNLRALIADSGGARASSISVELAQARVRQCLTYVNTYNLVYRRPQF